MKKTFAKTMKKAAAFMLAVLLLIGCAADVFPAAQLTAKAEENYGTITIDFTASNGGSVWGGYNNAGGTWTEFKWEMQDAISQTWNGNICTLTLLEDGITNIWAQCWTSIANNTESVNVVPGGSYVITEEGALAVADEGEEESSNTFTVDTTATNGASLYGGFDKDGTWTEFNWDNQDIISQSWSGNICTFTIHEEITSDIWLQAWTSAYGNSAGVKVVPGGAYATTADGIVEVGGEDEEEGDYGTFIVDTTATNGGSLYGGFNDANGNWVEFNYDKQDAISQVWDGNIVTFTILVSVPGDIWLQAWTADYGDINGHVVEAGGYYYTTADGIVPPPFEPYTITVVGSGEKSKITYGGAQYGTTDGTWHEGVFVDAGQSGSDENIDVEITDGKLYITVNSEDVNNLYIGCLDGSIYVDSYPYGYYGQWCDISMSAPGKDTVVFIEDDGTTQKAGTTVVVHYSTPKNIEGWCVGSWFTKEINGSWGSKDTSFTYRDDYGYVAVINYAEDLDRIGFKLHQRVEFDQGGYADWYRVDCSYDRYVDITDGFAEVWLTYGEEEVSYDAAENPVFDGYNGEALTQFQNAYRMTITQPVAEAVDAYVIMHYAREDKNYDKWGVGIWGEVSPGTWKDETILFKTDKEGLGLIELDDNGFDADGYKVALIPLSEYPVFQLGFKLHQDNWAVEDKYNQDRYIDITGLAAGDVLHVYVYEGEATVYRDKYDADLHAKFFAASSGSVLGASAANSYTSSASNTGVLTVCAVSCVLSVIGVAALAWYLATAKREEENC